MSRLQAIIEVCIMWYQRITLGFATTKRCGNRHVSRGLCALTDVQHNQATWFFHVPWYIWSFFERLFFFFFFSWDKCEECFFFSANKRSKEKVKGNGKGKLEVKLWQKRKKIANSPARNRAWDLSKRGWSSTIEPPIQATSPASLFEIFSFLLSLPFPLPSTFRFFPFLFLSGVVEVDLSWHCESTDFHVRLIFVNFIIGPKFNTKVLTKGVFRCILFDGRPAFTNQEKLWRTKLVVCENLSFCSKLLKEWEPQSWIWLWDSSS